MRDVLLDLRRRGKTVVLSSHQMETVERLCDAIALIHRGREGAGGAVSEVKSRHGKNTIVLAYEGDGAFLAGLPGVQKVSDFGRYVEMRMADGADPQAILRAASARLRVSRFEVVEPSLHDIFVEQVTAAGGRRREGRMAIVVAPRVPGARALEGLRDRAPFLGPAAPGRRSSSVRRC